MNYRLSDLADTDFQNLYLHGIITFGILQADKYKMEMQDTMKIICQNPQIGRIMPKTEIIIYRFTFKSHIIFYSISKNFIEIERILHKSVDIPRHFPQ